MIDLADIPSGWQSLASPTDGRTGSGLASYGGNKIYAFGGIAGSNKILCYVMYCACNEKSNININSRANSGSRHNRGLRHCF